MAEAAELSLQPESIQLDGIPVLRLVDDAPERPIALSVPELEWDELVRARAARFIGKCVTKTQSDIGPEVEFTRQPIESLYDAIHLAAEGDLSARHMVEINARTDIVERTIKSGHITEVKLGVDDAGALQQHGHRAESIHANSLRLAASNPSMLDRTKAEATNNFRIKYLHEQGILEDYYFVVFSRAPDDMSQKQMQDVGFFTDTMSCAIQVTSAIGDELTIESAFVSGVKQAGDKRHDKQTVAKTAIELGVDLEDKSDTETIYTPLLVPKSATPNGVVDIVKLYDKNAGGTFFGDDRPNRDYETYKQDCAERELFLQPKVDGVVQELIENASNIKSPEDAVRLLHKLSEKHMVMQAVFDPEINPNVFGQVAAVHIEQARIQIEQGNYDIGLDEIAKAKSTAKSSSCPSLLNESSELTENINDKNNGSNQDCEFVSKECPQCHAKNVKTKVQKTSGGKKKISGSCGCAVII